MKEADRRVGDAIEHTGFDGGVVEHVLKDYLIAYLKRLWETPAAHEVARETTVAPKPVDTPVAPSVLRSLNRQRFRPSHLWLIRHLQTVGHVASETDIEDGRLYAMVGHDVHHL